MFYLSMPFESNEVVSAVEEEDAVEYLILMSSSAASKSPDIQLKVPVAIQVGKFYNFLSFPSRVSLKKGKEIDSTDGCERKARCYAGAWPLGASDPSAPGMRERPHRTERGKRGKRPILTEPAGC